MDRHTQALTGSTVRQIGICLLFLLFAVPVQAQVIIDEDFTDGAFDDTGAGRKGCHWKIHGTGDVAFRKPNNRPFPLSLARRVSVEGHPWSGAVFGIWEDKNKNGEWNDGELKKFRVHKRDEVAVLKFVGFSDIAAGNENYYGVEVAMMEWCDAFAGPPHHSHDLSFEAMLRFPTTDPTQLDANVENIGTPLYNAHWKGAVTTRALSRVYTNLVIWRNRPGEGKTNCEQWGTLCSGDSDCSSEMNSEKNADSLFAEFDHIQVTLFRSGGLEEDFCRDGVDLAEAQVGILNVHVGVTKRCDFTLDYTVDARDVAVLRQNWYGKGAATLRTGDADNDRRVGLRDACAVTGYWAEADKGRHVAEAFYQPVTGEITVTLQGMSFFSLSATNDVFGSAAPGLGMLDVTLSRHEARETGAFTTNAWNVVSMSLGRIARPRLPDNTLWLKVNYRGSGNPEGIIIPVGVRR